MMMLMITKKKIRTKVRCKEFWQCENQHKPNLEETETVNLGDQVFQRGQNQRPLE